MSIFYGKLLISLINQKPDFLELGKMHSRLSKFGKLILILIVWLLWAALTVLPEQTFLNFPGFGLEYVLNGSLPIRLLFFNLMEPICLAKCTVNALCTAANYIPHSRTCELNQYGRVLLKKVGNSTVWVRRMLKFLKFILPQSIVLIVLKTS